MFLFRHIKMGDKPGDTKFWVPIIPEKPKKTPLSTRIYNFVKTAPIFTIGKVLMKLLIGFILL